MDVWVTFLINLAHIEIYLVVLNLSSDAIVTPSTLLQCSVPLSWYKLAGSITTISAPKLNAGYP